MNARKRSDNSTTEPTEPKTTKSNAIRQKVAAMKAEGTPVKAAEIVRRLQAEGVVVSAGHVSQVLKASGNTARKSKDHSFTLSDLQSARRLIAAVGSARAAKELIDAITAN